MNTYPHLFEPLDLGHTTLKNRIFMASMHMRFELMGNAEERAARFYAERAKGGVALVVTGGYAPNPDGAIEEGAHFLNSRDQVAAQKIIPTAVHEAGSRVALQILHAGRYAKVDTPVGPSDIPSPINRRQIHALTTEEVEQTVEDFVTTAGLAREAGFDGVEIMGSEGYLITTFCTAFTNNRSDHWGGTFENRIRFPVEIVRRTRESLGDEFLILYRISALDLMEGGLTGAETRILAQEIERAGADILTTGIGWHESRVPTIAHMVPQGGWRHAARQIREAVSIPVAATNRINTPEIANSLIGDGDADIVALARPMLADPYFAAKAEQGRGDAINTCIGCNQACLDFIFQERGASCLVNPAAGREFDTVVRPAARPLKIAVAGGGPAGMAAALKAATRGHSVSLFESDARLGGQFNLAKQVPGKGDFSETIRYFRTRLAEEGVDVRLSTPARAEDLEAEGFDHIVIATGVVPREVRIDGADHDHVLSYVDVLGGDVEIGERVAIIGSGGIGFDVALFLAASGETQKAGGFLEKWGIDSSHETAGGLGRPKQMASNRNIVMLQRSERRPGASLGLTTGWVIRSELRSLGVHNMIGVTYGRIDDSGLHVSVDGEESLVEADTIVVCAGQEPKSQLYQECRDLGMAATRIGGALETTGLDALRAITQGTEIGESL